MKKKILLLILAALLVGSVFYIKDDYPAAPSALALLEGTSRVAVVSQADALAFVPEQPAAGFIFYPGGKVDYRAYAPLMTALAEADILCVVARMPGNLAVLDINAAEDIPARFPEITRWFIGGHSLGGSMAASFASDREDYQGLVLLAAYSTADLGDLPVCSVYGSKDGVLNREKYSQYRENLPETVQEYILEGGNHAGFGSYGPQKGDAEATLSPEEQIRRTAEILAGFMK